MRVEPAASSNATAGAGAETAEELRRWLEEALTAARGTESRIVAIRRRPSPFASLSPAEEISLTLNSGQAVNLFGKYLGPEERDHPEKQCRDREIRIYEELFKGEVDLPVPRYLGARWDAESGRRQVFLEHLDDWSLQYHELKYWFEAARRLAHFHAHFARRSERLNACDFLLRFDAPYLTEWARRAQAAVGRWLPKLATELRPIVEGYGRVTTPIQSQPPTLVHNDLAPKNVIACRTGESARIALVDWEMAGVGCGVLDLVHLKHGLGAEDDRRMCDVYFQALAESGCGTPVGGAREQLLTACDLHITMYRLAFGQTWSVPAETMAQWVDDVRRMYAGLAA
jgi:thiamine kinase-like enzyme